MMQPLYIKEIFYSLQGEGANAGRAAIFIRLSGCNLSCSFCDTDFSQGQSMTLEQITRQIAPYRANFIVWTGGEPTLQLSREHTTYLRALGYVQAIETNGTRTVPEGIDYISCSPKVEALPWLDGIFADGVDEWRFLIQENGTLPPPIDSLPPAKHYFLSPVFDDRSDAPNAKALDRCIQTILVDPRWQLSIQLHKLIGIQ